ncbi:hypothetical protein EVAR_63320_1 [Eumeta japonica]|uniref:Uncharacterized protein n=1 Tax=Eumeta variegata TaxID=151549 RepID=A0A4C1YPQ1_EUMVA|nr:hypothetical protein EVAR_63320_1 [Eumeta japonica]
MEPEGKHRNSIMKPRVLAVFGLVEIVLRCTLTMNDFQDLMMQPEVHGAQHAFFTVVAKYAARAPHHPNQIKFRNEGVNVIKEIEDDQSPALSPLNTTAYSCVRGSLEGITVYTLCCANLQRNFPNIFENKDYQEINSKENENVIYTSCDLTIFKIKNENLYQNKINVLLPVPPPSLPTKSIKGGCQRRTPKRGPTCSCTAVCRPSLNLRERRGSGAGLGGHVAADSRTGCKVAGLNPNERIENRRGELICVVAEGL